MSEEEGRSAHATEVGRPGANQPREWKPGGKAARARFKGREKEGQGEKGSSREEKDQEREARNGGSIIARGINRRKESFKSKMRVQRNGRKVTEEMEEIVERACKQRWRSSKRGVRVHREV